MGYLILENEYVPDSLKNKSRWALCAILASAILVVTLTSVGIGAFIGYAYCFIEHRQSRGDQTQFMNLQITGWPYQEESEEVMKNRTINTALTNILVSKILKISQLLLDENSLSSPNMLLKPT